MAKTISLYLYEDIQPNYNNTYYLTNSTEDIKTHLTSYLSETVTADNYRVNSNVIKIKNAGTNLYSNITYAIEEIIEEGSLIYWRCYHVKSIDYQSSYTILYCEVDIWGTYFHNAKLNNINVNRCNRNIGVGLLDAIASTSGTGTRQYIPMTNFTTSPHDTWPVEYMNIVFALKYNVAQTLFGDSSTRIGLFAFNLKTLKQALYDANQNEVDAINYARVNAIDLAIDVVSGIYGIAGTSLWNTQGTLDATVIGAWFTNAVSVKTRNDITIKSKAMWHNYEDVDLHPYEVIPYEAIYTLSITNDFNKQLYIGTMQNGLKLQRTTETTVTCGLKVIASQDKLQFIAYQGDNQLDITNSFSVVCGTTDAGIATERQILHAVETGAKLIASYVALKNTASETAKAIGALSLASNLSGSLTPSTHTGNIVNGGDGANALYNPVPATITNPTTAIAYPLKNPYIINAYTSIDDEKANARIFGARFSEPISSIYNVFSSALLGTGSLASTYIKATCNVDEVPTDACDFIQNVLNSGAYFIDIRPNDNN